MISITAWTMGKAPCAGATVYTKFDYMKGNHFNGDDRASCHEHDIMRLSLCLAPEFFHFFFMLVIIRVFYGI